MIRINHLKKDFGLFRLDDISFSVAAGSTAVISGHNGAGKTLLLETVAGFWKPDSGEIYLEDKDITEVPPEKRNLGFVYQELFLFPHLSVIENIKFGLHKKKYTSEQIKNAVEKVDFMLNLGNLLDRKNVQILSGGEKQKIALARSLAPDPPALLLDEPTHMLDSYSREGFLDVLFKLKKTGKTILIVTHENDLFRALSDISLIMEGGKCLKN